MSWRPALRVVPAWVIALSLTACGGSSSSSSSSATATAPAAATSTSASSSSAASSAVKITSATLPGLGTVLVNAQGRTLYIFAPDNNSKVTCVAACAAVWPPAVLPAGAKPVAAGQVKQSQLGSAPDPAGGRVITYAGWPLYTYVTDTGSGEAHGQALNLNGGLWYVISPSGQVIKKTP
jgi:predicted lipoprotein with Yx(FWY)xxD motif